MKFKSPSPRLLTICWLILMGLTVGTMFSGQVTMQTSLSALLIVTLGLITWFKSMLILRYYLNLRTASSGWNKALNSYLFIVLGIITTIFLLGKF